MKVKVKVQALDSDTVHLRLVLVLVLVLLGWSMQGFSTEKKETYKRLYRCWRVLLHHVSVGVFPFYFFANSQHVFWWQIAVMQLRG